MKQYDMTPTRYAILRALNIKGGMSQTQIGKHMEVPRVTIIDNINFLEKEKLVSRNIKHLHTRGRPQWIYHLTKEGESLLN